MGFTLNTRVHWLIPLFLFFFCLKALLVHWLIPFDHPCNAAIYGSAARLYLTGSFPFTHYLHRSPLWGCRGEKIYFRFLIFFSLFYKVECQRNKHIAPGYASLAAALRHDLVYIYLYDQRIFATNASVKKVSQNIGLSSLSPRHHPRVINFFAVPISPGLSSRSYLPCAYIQHIHRRFPHRKRRRRNDR